MMTINQGMSFAEIKKIVAQRVANATETIAIYEEKSRMTRESMSHQTAERQVKCGNYEWFAHQTRDCRTSVLRAKQRPSVAKQKAEVTCYECGMLGYSKSDCPIWKCHNHVNKYWNEKAHGNSSVMENNVDV
uniref:CCHC-type domain-containing protein n=1 Tax=Tanacetum cinerariifolium TaxID=118510 RepID=A0A699KWQ1_TANCI|nr:hypothetical protein [Tanacetum cinerariifolium]